jgi:hypothetical protein
VTAQRRDPLDTKVSEYALVDGYAIAAHGFNRFSEDIDILVNPAPENSRRWIVALSRLPDGAAKELAGEQDVFAVDKLYAIRINDEFTVDVMPAVAGLRWEDMKQHVVSKQIDDVTIKLLDMKRTAEDKARHPAQGSDGRSGAQSGAHRGWRSGPELVRVFR